MTTAAPHGRRHEQGLALFVTMLILMLVGAIAVAAVDFAGEELMAGGRSRAAARNFYAADAGVEFALNRLRQSPRVLAPFTLTLDDGTQVQSRARDDASPQVIADLGAGPPRSGYSLNIGGATTLSSNFYRVNVTAVAPGGSTKELEVKVSADTASSGSSAGGGY